MADTYTAIFGLTKPQIGSTGWGPKLNTDFDDIDAAVFSDVTASATPAFATGTLTVDVSAGVYQAYTLTATTNIVFTGWLANFPNSAAQLAQRVVLKLTQSAAQTVTWDAAVSWLTGTAPVLNPSGATILEFVTINNGTGVLGWVALGAASITSGMLQASASLIGSAGVASTTSGTESTLGQVTIPGGTFASTGDALRIYAMARQNNTSPGSPFGTLRVRVGGSTYVASVTQVLSSAATPVILEVMLTSLSPTLLAASAKQIDENGTVTTAYTTVVATLSGPVDVYFRAKQSVTDIGFPFEMDQAVVSYA